MSPAKRSRAAVAVVGLLAVLLLTAGVAVADVITADTQEQGRTYDGQVQDFSQLTRYVYVTIQSGRVSGSGLTIAGKASAATTANDVGISYQFNGGTISAPVQFANSILPNSAFVFSGTTVTMASLSSSAFVLVAGSFIWNTTLTLKDMTASWPSTGTATGSLVSAASTFAVVGRSAIFVETSKVSYASSVLSVSTTAASVRVGSGSVVALDDVSCVSCRTSLVAVTAALTVTDSSLFRVWKCASGAVPLVSQSKAVTVSASSLYSVTDSTATSSFFRYQGAFAVTGASAVSYKKLTGGAASGVPSSGAIPTTVSADSKVYGDGACSFSGRAMSSAADFLSNGLRVTVFTPSAECNAATCVPGLSSGASPSGGRCRCACTSGTYQPSCTYMSDPLGVRADGGGASCSLFKCTQCSASALGQCEVCQLDYRLDETAKTCVRVCKDANCATCDNNGVCQVCAGKYQLTGARTCLLCDVSGCTRCTAANVCGQCQASTTLYNNQCVPCNVGQCGTCRENNVCSVCSKGYTLYSNTCVACTIWGCKTCNSPNVCQKCEGNLQITFDRRSCLCSTSACSQCNAYSCVSCDSGYRLESGNRCVRIASGEHSPLGVLAAVLTVALAVLAALSL